MAVPPEALRLFEAGSPGEQGSQPETSPTVSRTETDQIRTPSGDLSNPLHESQALRDTFAAAILVEEARRALSDAIAAARSAGYSWRAIGAASGIPYQTLHRNRRSPADRDSPETDHGR